MATAACRAGMKSKSSVVEADARVASTPTRHAAESSNSRRVMDVCYSLSGRLQQTIPRYLLGLLFTVFGLNGVPAFVQSGGTCSFERQVPLCPPIRAG